MSAQDSKITEIELDPAGGYGVLDCYTGQKVKVFLHCGQSITGLLTKRAGKFIQVRNMMTRKECIVNLDWVASTALDLG